MCLWALDDWKKDNWKRGAYDLYRNTAGEIEARDAASRRNFTQEQRRNKKPSQRDWRTVFAEENQGLAKDQDSAGIAEDQELEGLSLPTLDNVRAAGENFLRDEYFKGRISTETIEEDIQKVASISNKK